VIPLEELHHLVPADQDSIPSLRLHRLPIPHSDPVFPLPRRLRHVEAARSVSHKTILIPEAARADSPLRHRESFLAIKAELHLRLHPGAQRDQPVAF